MKTLKRYGLALFFLLVVVGLMKLGTMGAKSFSDKMVRDANIQDVQNVEGASNSKRGIF
ncbi:MAG: hypothetical protein L3J10_08075 [Sulfurimonas sp.]|nr:hypothetical protein [Sulfurimonas sp.]